MTARSLTTWIPQSECVTGALYRIASRNLRLGVWNGEDGFIGVRKKWGDEYLDTELHWDACKSFGTAKPIERLPESVPDRIPLEEGSGDLYEWLQSMREKYEDKR